MRYYQTGVLHHDRARAFPGYTLAAAFRHRAVRLVDMEGREAHRWDLPGALGSKAYVLPGGNLLCSLKLEDGPQLNNAVGGWMVELDWSGKIVWEHRQPGQHHDVRRMPNGNTMFIMWDALPQQHNARVRGGVPGTEKDGVIYADIFREVTPSGEIAWEWRFADADYDKYPLAHDCQREEWAHANSCAPTLDGNVLVSFRHLDTIMIIERATKKIIWDMRDDTWGHQHNPEMLPGGNILLFANGMNNLRQPLFSRVLEINPATKETVWSFQDPQKWTFFTPVMGGAQRLDNGNTLICEAINGRYFEVTREGEIVWDFINPFFEETQGVLGGKSNASFRCYRYAKDSPELQGRF